MTVLDLSHHNPPGTPTNAQAVIIRTTYGENDDNAAAEHARCAESASVPWMFYYYHLSRRNPTRTAEIAFATSGGRRRRGWADLEESTANDGAEPAFPRYSEAYWQHVNAGMVRCDALTGLTTGIYTRASWLNWWFTAEQQRRWAHRPLWIAHWLKNGLPLWPDLPLGWTDYALWQTGFGPWLGMVGNVDYNELRPGLALDELLGLETPMQYLLTVRDTTTSAALTAALGGHLVALQAVIPIDLPPHTPPPVSDPPLYSVRIKVAVLNVRSGPGTTNPVVQTLTQNTLAAVYAESGGWGRIAPEVQLWINVGAAYVERVPPAI